MKKIARITMLTLLIGMFALISTSFGQRFSATTLKAGYFDPKSSKAGFIFGGSYSWIVDESVDIGIAVDYFRKNHSKDSTEVLADETRIIELEKYTSNIIPIYGIINVKFPAGMYMDYFLSGGLGYEWLIRKEKIHAENLDRTRTYGGMKWIIAAGITYRIGSQSSFLAEAFYDGSKVDRKDKQTGGKLQVDVSGFGIRVGVRMGFH